ncbi:hypothetical protein SBA2_670013 [Acidobacteriia bacterium SbA2]|nr:hypothetical protein SBA2_670013 [Acidobacteriia bacterium SbA2]
MRKLSRDRMTARQRIECTLRGELPDRLPVFDLIQHIPLIEYVTGEKVTLENGLDLVCRTIGERLDITRGIAAPAEEKIIRNDDGFVYKQEWWTTWLIDRPFNDAEGLLDYIPRNIEELHNRKFGDMFTFAGKSNVWGASSKSPREQFLELQEKVGGNTVIFPNESPVGLDTAHVRAGLDLLVYAYAENPQLVSDWLEALNWAEIQRVHETADPTLSPVALVFADIASTEQIHRQHGADLLLPAVSAQGVFPAADQTGQRLARARDQGDLPLRRQPVGHLGRFPPGRHRWD